MNGTSPHFAIISSMKLGGQVNRKFVPVATSKSKSTKKPQTKKLPLVENRRLQDQNPFRSIGKEYPFSL